VNARDAVSLLSDAVPKNAGGVWADFGAGNGVFSHALAELLGPASRIYAVDRDAAALSAVDRWTDALRRNVIPVVADFSHAFELPGINGTQLDGALFANTLHFLRDADAVLARLASCVRPGGRVVFIEYDRRGPNRWVPFPISFEQLPTLVASAGLSSPVIKATRPSAFGGDLYVAAADRLVPE
jgi:ubiquinone/menaquinone biosynthesis C-methylase UbiE